MITLRRTWDFTRTRGAGPLLLTDSTETGFPGQVLISLKFIRKLLKHLIRNTTFFFPEWVVNYIIQKVLSENGLRTISLLRCFSVLMEADGCLGIPFSLWFFFLFTLPPTLPSVSPTFPSSSSCIWWCLIREVHSSNENNSSNKIVKVPADLIPGETYFLARSHLPPFVSSCDHFFVLTEREKESSSLFFFLWGH